LQFIAAFTPVSLGKYRDEATENLNAKGIDFVTDVSRFDIPYVSTF
jgi:hypothetical protein